MASRWLNPARFMALPCNTLLLAYTNVKAFEQRTRRRALVLITFPMSAIGTKRTWLSRLLISAIGGKADIQSRAARSAFDPSETSASIWREWVSPYRLIV